MNKDILNQSILNQDDLHKNTFYIRTDGNSQIATGHLTRCLSIASSLNEMGCNICFLLSDKESEKLLLQLSHSLFSYAVCPFSTHILTTACYNKLESEIKELISFICPPSHLGEDERRPVLLIDSYFVTEKYLRSLKKQCRLAYIDDIRAFDYPADLLINYDYIPEHNLKEYEDSYKNSSKLLLGTAYTPLRPQFRNKTASPGQPVREILLTSGGSDSFHILPSIAEQILQDIPSVRLHLVVGSLFNNIPALEALAAKNSHILLHSNVSDMASLMCSCDLAISASGTTLYELCALSLPAISFTMADNQIPTAEIFHHLQAVFYAGDIRNHKDNVIQNIIKYIKKCSSSHHFITSQRNNMHTLVDGFGADRIATSLIRLTCDASQEKSIHFIRH